MLGHEIAHALREHSREQLSQRSLSDSVIELIAHSGLPYAAPAAMLASLGSTYLVRMPFSQQMELEADLMGIELMARAGYDPRLAPEVWRKMQAETATAGGWSFCRRIRRTSERIEQIERAHAARHGRATRRARLLAPLREAGGAASPPAGGLSPSRRPRRAGRAVAHRSEAGRVPGPPGRPGPGLRRAAGVS